MDREFYLASNNFSIRKCFTGLRISDQNLEIEKDRYDKIPRKDRICKLCHLLEDEKQFLLECRINKQNTKAYFIRKVLTFK